MEQTVSIPRSVLQLIGAQAATIAMLQEQLEQAQTVIAARGLAAPALSPMDERSPIPAAFKADEE